MNFFYLGSLINCQNNSSDEIRRRFMQANSCYFNLQKQLSSGFLTEFTKLIVYKTLILTNIDVWFQNVYIYKRPSDLEKNVQ